MKINISKLLKLPPYVVSIVTLYEIFVKYTGTKLPNLTSRFSYLVHGNIYLLMSIILVLIIALIPSCIFLAQKIFKRKKYYKYCPECDLGIDAKNPGIYCHCGTKYLKKCPECNKKIEVVFVLTVVIISRQNQKRAMNGCLDNFIRRV